MKQIFLIVAFMGSLVFGQTGPHVIFDANVDAPLTARERAMIVEAFGDKAQAYVFDQPFTERDLKDFLRNRVKVIRLDRAKYQNEPMYQNLPQLQNVGLYDVHNSSVIRDMVYNESTFNILKYDINHHPVKEEIYQFGDYFITILPQKRGTIKRR
ncbi:MAG: hypothetical protein Q4F57_02055 [Weeksellaceae bacterium]|nr:hypothetical protein [Weeksellaceae bacterium]